MLKAKKIILESTLEPNETLSELESEIESDIIIQFSLLNKLEKSWKLLESKKDKELSPDMAIAVKAIVEEGEL